jgi:hypothetical protein
MLTFSITGFGVISQMGVAMVEVFALAASVLLEHLKIADMGIVCVL